MPDVKNAATSQLYADALTLIKDLTYCKMALSYGILTYTKENSPVKYEIADRLQLDVEILTLIIDEIERRQAKNN